MPDAQTQTPDVQTAESSPAPEPKPIESWSSAERDTWLLEGKIPEQSKPAESTPAKESSEAEPSETPAQSESRPDSEPETKQESAPRRKGAEDRKAELSREIQDLLRQRAELRAEVTPKPAAKPAESAPATEGKPKPEQFKTYDEYVEALTDYKADQREQMREQKAAQQRAAEAAKAAQDSWNSKVSEVKKQHADFDEVLGGADFQISPALYEAIQTDDHGPELAYHLAQHPDELERISQLSPVAGVRELGRISASFSKPKTPDAPKITRASKPPTEVAAKATAPADEVEAALKDGDFARYKRLMDARSLKAA